MNRLEQLKQLAASAPNDPFLRYAIALEHQAAGDLQLARQLLEVLLASDPDYLPTYYQLAQLLEVLEENQAARLIYADGIALAEKTGDAKTARELRAALDLLD
ncbi:MAG: hypothetical protein U0T84_03065 [Chitinophagales bacterium]